MCGGFIALIFGITAKKQAMRRRSQTVRSDPEKPWLKREDWAKGRIASGSKKSVFFLWLFTVIWNLISAPVVFIGLPAELHKGNHAILIALLFPMVGIGMIIYALNTTLAWRKFGQSIFEMAAIPGAPGGTLEGEIQVKTKLQPQHGLHLRLSCIRQTTTGSRQKPQHERKNSLAGRKMAAAGFAANRFERHRHSGLFQIACRPAGINRRPTATESTGGSKRPPNCAGRIFMPRFEVPVFKLSEPPEISDDPTAQYQMSLDEVRQQIHSKIQVNDLPDGGKEFIFPAARNVGPAAGLTLIWLIWTGIVVALF